MHGFVVISLCLLTAAVGGCGGASDDTPSMPPSPSSEEATHIHGLGINPADGSLFIATHTGLFRAASDDRQAQRVGDSTQDTMGFTVTGADEFIGSGHPDARASLPSLLGLIRSTDAGRHWKPISLLGEADFHVLRAAGPRIYGVNATDGRLMLSSDGGRTWARRSPPSGLVDLAGDPDNGDHIVASAEDRLLRSTDAGRSWRPLNSRAGLLAWPSGRRLYLIDGAGTSWTSEDGGGDWTKVGEIGGQPAALAAHDDELYVALHTNEVKVSRDGGRTWALRARP